MTDGTDTSLEDAEIINQLIADHRESTGQPDGGADGEACETSESNGKAAVKLRMRLSTLLGLDEYPAELAGWGPMHAELARDLAGNLGGAQWRFAITRRAGAPTALRDHPRPARRQRHARGGPILEPLPDPIARDRAPMPLLVPVDSDWESSQIWEESPEPEPEPPATEPDSSDDIPPF